MWNALNTVKSQMILNTTEPKIVRIAGRSECPIPLSAPPLISYEPDISSRSITIAILMIAYLITVGSVVKKVMKNPLPSMNITLTQPVKIQLKSIQSLNTFLRIQRCGYFADSMAVSKTYGFGNRSCVGYNSVKF